MLQSASLDRVLLQPIGRERLSEFVRRKGFESYKVIPYSLLRSKTFITYWNQAKRLIKSETIS